MSQAKPLAAGARVPRLFCGTDPAPGARLQLPESSAHHAARVLRLVPGDAVHIFSGDGDEWAAEISGVTRSGVSVRVSQRLDRDVEARLRVTLAQGISARERMDFTLQKAVELGVAEIQPLETRRSLVRLREERASRRVEHWQSLAIAACEQCGRNRIPPVRQIETLSDWLGSLRGAEGRLRVLLSPAADTRLRDLPAPEAVLLLVGPEGGLATEEQELALVCGFIPVRLGPRVLRTETAALAAVAAMHALWGDF
ncbi:MAG: 16S rRNA (uracil(1498)-N(3))-methyltransferase [Burkholderiales bacterium]|nr:16S rRNA (uracil(1498)-N(3))-methyltransferase [Burkholderiales bacterium]